MEFILNIIFLAVLAGIAFHDIRNYSIPLYLLIATLAVAGTRLVIMNNAGIAFQLGIINLIETILILLLTILSIFILRKRVFNPVDKIIGSGDLLFIPVICFSFSPLYYILFIIISSIVIIILKIFFNPSERYIPLAGLQAVFLAVSISLAQIIHLDLYNDGILLNLLT